MARMRELAPGQKLDRYEITELMSRGGMACVFKAIDLATGATVVLKVPHEQLEGDVVFFERFSREEEIGRRVTHPGIVRFLDPGEKSRPYIAMEYVPGSSLRAVLRSAPRLPIPRALDIGRQLAAALVYLHEHGIVHRDVKPENVVLVPPGGGVKLLDFGIAFLESARRMTWAGLSGVLGTPDYMAPEQIQGRRGDARTDVYALGTILYEMVTGHLPFDAPDALSMMHAKTHRDATPARQHLPDLDPGLEAVLSLALARDRRDRYANARELLADLDEPHRALSRVAARPPTRMARRWPWRWGWGAAAACVLIGAAAACAVSAGRIALDRSSPAPLESSAQPRHGWFRAGRS